MFSLLLIFILGMLLLVQTASNSRLRQSVGSPLVASLVSFSVGTLFLIFATLIQKDSLGISAETFGNLLSVELTSAVLVALFSFLSATLGLLLIVLLRNDRRNLPQIFSTARTWWSWLGGIIGGTFVTGVAFLLQRSA